MSVLTLKTNIVFVQKAIVIVSMLLAYSLLNSAYAENIVKKKQTTLGLYFTPKQAHDHMIKQGEKTLFIDVRDPVEVSYIGMPSIADANVPLKFSDTSKWHMKKKQFGMKLNGNFVAGVEQQMKAKGLTKSDTVILMCRSGVRSAKAVNKLAKAGFTNVYNLFEGFEGDSVKKGSNKGRRTVNGWKNAGLPWSPPKSLDISKMYGNPSKIVVKKK